MLFVIMLICLNKDTFFYILTLLMRSTELLAEHTKLSDINKYYASAT